jgi:anaerobic selenocysteine-containing dehydrogenase
VVTSLAKAWYGNAATKENDFAYDYFPKLGGASDVLSIFNDMFQGKINGFFCQGFNPLASWPTRRRSAMRWQAEVHGRHGPAGDRHFRVLEAARRVQRSRPEQDRDRGLPSAGHLFAETAGTFTNSGRVVQWRWKAADGPGDSKDDTEIMAALFLKLKEMYAKDGGAFPDPILKLTWAYNQPAKPSPEELLREINGKALADVLDPKDPTKVLVKAGEQLPSFAHAARRRLDRLRQLDLLRHLVAGRQQHRKRDNSDPSGLGQTLNWGFAWPVNRRIIYNRASADLRASRGIPRAPC